MALDLLFPVLLALAGLMWPSNDPAIRRLQRCLGVLVACSALTLLFGVIVLVLGKGRFDLFVIACLLMLPAGAMGKYVEIECKRKSKPKP